MPNKGLNEGETQKNTSRLKSMDTNNIIERCSSPGIFTRSQLRRMSTSQINEDNPKEIKIDTPQKTQMRGKKVSETPQKMEPLRTPRRKLKEQSTSPECLTRQSGRVTRSRSRTPIKNEIPSTPRRASQRKKHQSVLSPISSIDSNESDQNEKLPKVEIKLHKVISSKLKELAESDSDYEKHKKKKKSPKNNLKNKKNPRNQKNIRDSKVTSENSDEEVNSESDSSLIEYSFSNENSAESKNSKASPSPKRKSDLVSENDNEKIANNQIDNESSSANKVIFQESKFSIRDKKSPKLMNPKKNDSPRKTKLMKTTFEENESNFVDTKSPKIINNQSPQKTSEKKINFEETESNSDDSNSSKILETQNQNDTPRKTPEKKINFEEKESNSDDSSNSSKILVTLNKNDTPRKTPEKKINFEEKESNSDDSSNSSKILETQNKNDTPRKTPEKKINFEEKESNSDDSSNSSKILETQNKNDTPRKTPEKKIDTPRKTPEKKINFEEKESNSDDSNSSKILETQNKNDTPRKTPEKKIDTPRKTPGKKIDTPRKTPEKKIDTPRKTPEKKINLQESDNQFSNGKSKRPKLDTNLEIKDELKENDLINPVSNYTNEEYNEISPKSTNNSMKSPSIKPDGETSFFRSPTKPVKSPSVENNMTPEKVLNAEMQRIKANLNAYDDESNDSDSDAESRKAIKRSAEKRIIENMSNSSESEVRTSFHKKVILKKEIKQKEEEEESDDSAPKDMSFKQGKIDAMESLKKQTDSIKHLNNLRKEKKRQRLELIKRQKEEKLIRLKEKRASEENASCSSSEETGYEDEFFQPQQKQEKINKEKENFESFRKLTSHIGFEKNEASDNNKESRKRPKPGSSLTKLSSEVLENLNEAPPVKIKKTNNFVTSSSSIGQINKSKNNVKAKHLESIDYIPLSTDTSTKFEVVPLNTTMGTTSLAAAAAAFRDRRLNGSHIQRINVKTINAYKQKRQLFKK